MHVRFHFRQLKLLYQDQAVFILVIAAINLISAVHQAPHLVSQSASGQM